MTFKFYRWPLLSLIAAQLVAQTPPATPTPTPKPSEGYVRFWNMLPAEAGELALYRDSGGGTPEAIAAASPANYSASYIPVKPGRYHLDVAPTADPTKKVKSFDLVMRANVFVSFLAHLKDGALTIEMLDDTFDRTKAVAGKLSVRHFMPGAQITITPAGRRATGPLREGAIEVLEEFPLKPVLIQMQAVLANGQKRDWSTEVNFKNTRHASLLLGPDPYGRFRPRVSPDGQPDFAEPMP